MAKTASARVALYAPPEYWAADEPERNAIVGGCGPGGVGDWFVPDTIWGLNVIPACAIHDWMYAFGATASDKKEADRVFLNNMIRLIITTPTASLLIRLRLRRATVYYKAVKKYGGPAFWDSKNKDNEMEEVTV